MDVIEGEYSQVNHLRVLPFRLIGQLVDGEGGYE